MTSRDDCNTPQEKNFSFVSNHFGVGVLQGQVAAGGLESNRAVKLRVEKKV